MSNSDLLVLKQQLRDFAEARDWDQFHSPKNLSMALSAEVAEIIEHLTNHGCSNVVGAGRTGTTQWLTEEQSQNLPVTKLKEVETELADTLIYLVRLADKLDIDLLKAAENKIDENEQRYSIDKAKGDARKYTEYE